MNKVSISDSPFDEGYNASLKNRPLNSCPYAKETLAAQYWVTGWNRAYLKAMRA
jgi:ribosome modulation factor